MVNITNSRADLFTFFQSLEDPRIERTKAHLLYDIVVIAVCAAIGGADTWADVERFGKSKYLWFRKFLKLPNGIPSHDTFSRVFAALDTEAFLECLLGWVNAVQEATVGRIIAIDGKTLRGSYDKADGRSALHMVSAWATQNHLCLGQLAVDDKSNEITAIPKLLEFLELQGAIVTIDAMGCQKEITAKIREKEADYVITVKENQPKLYEAITDEFLRLEEMEPSESNMRRHVTVERGHGRTERREYCVAPAPEHIRRLGFMDVKSIGMVLRERNVDGKTSAELRFSISSLRPRVKQFAAATRGHWSIENTLHWSLDVTFSEDNSRIRKGNGPQTSALLRRFVLSILKQDTTLKSSLRGKRLIAGWNEKALERILGWKQGN